MPVGAARAGVFGSTSAIPDSVVDNFETVVYEGHPDGSRSLTDYYSGDTGSASRVNATSTAQEGDYYLELESGPTSNAISSVKGTSTTDLPRYPQPGDVWRFWVYPDTEDVHVYHARQTEDNNRDGNGYSVFLGGSRNEFSLDKDGKFGGSELDLATPSVSTSSWYEIEVQWAANGDMTCTLFDADGTQVAQISGNDSTYTSEGIAWIANNNNNNKNLRFDHMRITGSV